MDILLDMDMDIMNHFIFKSLTNEMWFVAVMSTIVTYYLQE